MEDHMQVIFMSHVWKGLLMSVPSPRPDIDHMAKLKKEMVFGERQAGFCHIALLWAPHTYFTLPST